MSTPPWDPEREKAAVEELANDVSALCASMRATALALDCEPGSSYPAILPFEHLA